MASLILEHDEIHSLDYSWHRKDKIEKVITFERSGLNHELEMVPIYFELSPDEAPISIPDMVAIIRRDKKLKVHVCKPTYNIIQNSRIWESLEASLEGVDYRITNSGTLDNCKKMFVTVELMGQQEFVINRDKYKNYLIYSSTHDGTGGLERYDSGVRVVCGNTLAMSKLDKGYLNSVIYHTGYAEAQIKKMIEETKTLFVKRTEFYAKLETLTDKAMTLKQAESIIAGFLQGQLPVTEKSNRLSTRTQNNVAEFSRLFKQGIGNAGKTAYDLMNAGTEYYGYKTVNPQNPNYALKQYASSEFGSGAESKVEFVNALFNDELLEKLAANGEKLLRDSVDAVTA